MSRNLLLIIHGTVEVKLKMTRIFIILTISLILNGCCSFDKTDLEFDKQELRYFSDYKNGDTIFFESNLGDTDTIKIIGYQNEKLDKCGGLMTPQPSNTKWLTIQYLPTDIWHGTSQDMTKGTEVEIDYQRLLCITKYSNGNKTQYKINFKDFYSRMDSVIGEYHSETLKLNGVILSNYYEVEHGYPERITDVNHIEVVYWSDQDGLVAYKSKSGEIWTKKK